MRTKRLGRGARRKGTPSNPITSQGLPPPPAVALIPRFTPPSPYQGEVLGCRQHERSSPWVGGQRWKRCSGEPARGLVARRAGGGRPASTPPRPPSTRQMT